MPHPNSGQAFPADSDIIERIRAGDESALRIIEQKYGAYLLTVAKNMLGGADDCEECLNDTYLALWNNLKTEQVTSLRAYSAGILRRKALHTYRARSRKCRVASELTSAVEDLDSLPLSGCDTESEFDLRELSRIINGFIRSLGSDDRYIFISRFYESFPVSDIAAELSLTQSAVYKRITAIKTKLKKLLERNGYEL